MSFELRMYMHKNVFVFYSSFLRAYGIMHMIIMIMPVCRFTISIHSYLKLFPLLQTKEIFDAKFLH